MAILVPDGFQHTLVSHDFYEPLERHQPNRADYIELARRLLPNDWEYKRHGIWYNCAPPGGTVPAQGWKIHLSATPATAAPILAVAGRLLGRAGVPFKFAVDRRMLQLLNTKNWTRGGAGKFVTIYPSGIEECSELLAALERDLRGYRGPYILSDRRYRDSKVVYYRYGSLARSESLHVNGGRVSVMRDPDGSVVEDERTPYFRLPDGVLDPFIDRPAAENDDSGSLNGGRYLVEAVLNFSNAGGVYQALDTQTGARVVVKEARPSAGLSLAGTDATWQLAKEYRLLRALADTGVAPRPIDYFHDWEHSYLVEEFVEGQNLRSFMHDISASLYVRPTREHVTEFYRLFRKVYARVAEILVELHERGIVFGDVSHYNVLVGPDADSVRLIDFETAREIGVDLPTYMFTPGFAPAEVAHGGESGPADDRFGLGGLMLAGLMPINEMLGVEPYAHYRVLDAFERDLCLPPSVSQCIRGLMAPDRSDRLSLAHAVRVLREDDQAVGAPHVGSFEADAADHGALLRQMTRYIESCATPDRADRLFPGAPQLAYTNPLSVAYGAVGVAHALRVIGGRDLPEGWTDWILSRPITVDRYPPGLYVGMGGIAWGLLDLGFREEAERVARASHRHPLLWDSPDLLYGAAGWGTAQLKLFLATGDELYREKAVEAGRFLLATRRADDAGCWWLVDGFEYSGMGQGGAGISLFLLYLYLVTGDEAYLLAGHAALARVLGRGVRNRDGGLTWRVREGHPTATPYWQWGSAGVGATLLRYQQVDPRAAYANALDEITLDADRKYSIFPGRLLGLAGIGEYWLDVARFARDPGPALAAARKALSGVLLFRVDRDAGLAFPGETRMRISCDFGTGSAGIAMFVHRLHVGGDAAFTLDELLTPDRVRLPRAPAGDRAACALA